MSKNSKDATIIIPTKDIEIIKADYLKQCFEAAKKDLDNGTAIDGKNFFNDL